MDKDWRNELITKGAAFDALKDNMFRLTLAEEQRCEGHVVWDEDVVFADVLEKALLALPSAQSEIIHCGDCKYKDDGIDEDGIPFLKCLNGRSYGGTRINDYCSWAERRQE